MTVYWGTDDSLSIGATITEAVSLYETETGSEANKWFVYAPPGSYYIKATQLPVIVQAPIGLRGAGRASTAFIVDPEFEWDLFAWSNCHNDGITNNENYTTYPKNDYSSIDIRDFRVLGNQSSPNTISCIAWYDVNSMFLVDNIEVDYWPGSVLSVGLKSLAGSDSYITESSFNHIKAFRCGTTTAPVFLFGAIGTGDSTNECFGSDWQVFQSAGDGVVFSNSTTNDATSGFQVFGLRLEGCAERYSALRLGDPSSPTSSAGVSDIQIYACRFIANLGTDITVTGPSSTTQPHVKDVTITGNVINYQAGTPFITITNGSNLTFDFPSPVSSTATSIVTVSGAGSSEYFFRGSGFANLGLFNITLGNCFTDSYNALPATPYGAFFALDRHDGSSSDGTNVGAGSVDLQRYRTSAVQSAATRFSAILCGRQNTCSGSGTANVVGGQYSTASGANALLIGTTNTTGASTNNVSLIGSSNTVGSLASNVSLIGSSNTANASVTNVQVVGANGLAVSSNRRILSGGQIGTAGVNQISDIQLSIETSSTGTFQITALGAAASPTTIAALSNNFSYYGALVEVVVFACCKNAANNWYSWTLSQGVLYGGPGAGTPLTFTQNSDPVVYASGNGTAASLIPGVDTVNGGLLLEWIPPNGNAWHVNAWVRMTEA